MTTNLPPGTFGAPYIGETLEMLNDPYNYGKKRYDKYGPVFKTSLMGRKTVVMLGADAQKYVLGTNYRDFSWRGGYKAFLPLFGDMLATTDGEVHDSQRKIMTPAFHNRNMANYLDTINRIVDSELDEWGTSGTRQLYLEARKIAFRLASSLLIGVELGESNYDKLSKDWATFTLGIVAPVPINLPNTIFGRAMRAKKRVEPILREIIAERKLHPTQDALGLLVQSCDEQGNGLDDEQLLAQLKLLVFGGYDTSSSTMTWIVLELLRNPEYLERLKAEIRADDTNERISLDDLGSKPFLDAVIKETLRLHLPVFFSPRVTIKTFEFGGYTIPEGWAVILLPSFSHMLPQYFNAPLKFDPDRFLAPREEDSKHPYAWIGFGGGPRVCIGENIAKMQIKAMLIRILRRFDMQIVPNQDLSSKYIPATRPKSDGAITYQAR